MYPLSFPFFSYKHVQRLKESGLTAMTSVSGVVFLVGSLFFASVFACLAARIYFMKQIVNRKREQQKVSTIYIHLAFLCYCFFSFYIIYKWVL